MAVFTNVSPALINLHDGSTPLIPGLATDVNDEHSNNPRFQELVASGAIVAGTPPPVEPPVEPEGEVKVQTFYSANSDPAGQDTVSGGSSVATPRPLPAGTATVSGATTTAGGTKA